MTDFKQGAELCRDFYHQAVAPLLADSPPHAAALLDHGPEVLGFDTPMSTDHDWGPRLQLYFDQPHPQLIEHLNQNLPRSFQGYGVFYSHHQDNTANPDPDGTFHQVVPTTWSTFLKSYIQHNPITPPTLTDWLRFPSQKLRTISTGPIFSDSIDLTEKRNQFHWYPNDIWLYLLACQWQRIGQEEHLVARAGYVGDELGAQIIAARLVRDIIRLAFLLQRQYAPYPKWLGTAFQHLEPAQALSPLLHKILQAQTWQQRDQALTPAYQTIAELQNKSNLTEQRPTTPKPFHNRPFNVIELHSEFAQALQSKIQDPTLRIRPLTGSIDQISDNTDILESDSLGRFF